MPIFGAKSRAKRGCASKLACGHRIGPAEQSVFTDIFGEFVTFLGRRVSNPTAQFSSSPSFVGADDSVRPQNAPAFTEIYCEFAASQRAE